MEIFFWRISRPIYNEIMLPVPVLFLFITSIFLNIGGNCDIDIDENIMLLAEDTLEQSHGKLIYSTALFRHGERTPVDMYPQDPYPPSIWPEGMTQLTKEGKSQEYILGKWLRARYKTKLNLTSYNENLLVVNSTDTDRSLMSAELVLAGLFPPSDEEKFTTDDLNWQPIAIHSKPLDTDYHLYARLYCERFEYEQKSSLDDPIYREIVFDSKLEMFNYIADNSGYPLFDVSLQSMYQYLYDLYDDLLFEAKRNLTLPKWVGKVYPDFLKSLIPICLEITSHNFEMKRLRAGPLLELMVNDMLHKKSDESWKQVLHLYSAHDCTMAPILIALGVYDFIQPPLASAILIELRLKNDEYIVTMVYRNSTTERPYLLRIPECEKVCKLDTFIQITSKFFVEDWYEECQVGIFDKLTYFSVFGTALRAIFILAFIISIFYVVRMGYPYIKRKRREQYETFNDVNCK